MDNKTDHIYLSMTSLRKQFHFFRDFSVNFKHFRSFQNKFNPNEELINILYTKFKDKY